MGIIDELIDGAREGVEARKRDLPVAELVATAHGGGVLMAMRHRELPAEGVQFHPESVLTPHGKHLLANFLGEDGLMGEDR